MNEDGFEQVVARERLHRRRRRLGAARRRLRVHVWVFAAVNLGLVVAWLAQALVFGHAHPAWFAPTTLGWAAGLGVHALGVRQMRRSCTTPTSSPA